MINFQLRKILLNNKKVLENLSYISILQLFSIFLPLISYPYLIRVLGLELNGMIVFAYSIVSYLNLFISFGFNSSTTRNIASLESDKCISNIVFSTYLCKFILFSFSVCLFLLVISFSHGELLLPIWYFQGVEKMKYLTIINVGSRIVFTVFIFVFVKQKEDYILVPLFNSLGAILGGVYALYVLLAKERIRFSGINICSIKMNFRDSAPMFISSLSSLIYLNVNKLIVGSFLGMSEVSIYDIGEKVMNLLKIPTIVICQSVYPKMSRELNIRYMNRVMLTSFFFMLILYMIVCIYAKQIIEFFLGEYNSTGVILICILSFSSVLLTLNSMLGGNRLIPFGYARQLMKIMIINLLFYISLLSIIILSDKINMFNLAICTVFIELICVIMLMLKNKKLKILR